MNVSSIASVNPKMRKHGALIGELPLEPAAPDESLQHWLYRSLREAIISRRVPENSILPGTRTLALQYGLSRGTIQSVYCQLLAEGYLVARQGSATRVSPSLPDAVALLSTGKTETSSSLPTGPVRLESPWSKHLVSQPRIPSRHGGDVLPQPFCPHHGDVRSFPIDLWRQLHVRHLRSSRLEALSNADPCGLVHLRQAISGQLAIARGVAVSPENIVIMASVQQALDLCMRLLTEPGDSVWMEDPGHAGVRQVMLTNGAKVVDVPVDEHGMQVERGIFMAPNARLVYTAPTRQVPLGVVLSPERRASLLQWSGQQNAYVFEHDSWGEYRSNAKPIPALKSLPNGSRNVILAGTFDDLLFPTLRLSFLALPSHLVDPFRRAIALTGQYQNVLSQTVLADFIGEGHYDRHIRRMKKIYAGRAEAFEFAARRHWQGLIELPPGHAAGMDVVAHLVDMSEREAHGRLLDAGIEAFPLTRYTNRGDLRPSLVMGFAAFNEMEIDAAALSMATLLRKAA